MGGWVGWVGSWVGEWVASSHTPSSQSPGQSHCCSSGWNAVPGGHSCSCACQPQHTCHVTSSRQLLPRSSSHPGHPACTGSTPLDTCRGRGGTRSRGSPPRWASCRPTVGRLSRLKTDVALRRTLAQRTTAALSPGVEIKSLLEAVIR